MKLIFVLVAQLAFAQPFAQFPTAQESVSQEPTQQEPTEQEPIEEEGDEDPIALETENPFRTGTSFFWKLEGNLHSMPRTFDTYDIDLDAAEANPSLVRSLQAAGKTVICYFSAGSWENWRRPNRYRDISKSSIGNPMSGWDERWIDIRKPDVRQAQVDILKAAMQAGCDAVEPDNVDHYQNQTGFGITREDSIAYLQWLANTAHSLTVGERKGLRISLKNSGDIIAAGRLADFFDFAINESCFKYDECAPLKQFTNKGKAAYIVEYKTTFGSEPYPMSRFSADCSYARSNDMYFMVYRSQHVDGDIVALCK